MDKKQIEKIEEQKKKYKEFPSSVILIIAIGLSLLNFIISLEGVLYVIIILLYLYAYLKKRENDNRYLDLSN